jgi:hypothetical protein
VTWFYLLLVCNRVSCNIVKIWGYISLFHQWHWDWQCWDEWYV